jgi:hypothetical protein
MTKSGLARSLRKFLRREKARLRREFSDADQAEAKIRELVERIMPGYHKKARADTSRRGKKKIRKGASDTMRFFSSAVVSS